MLQLDKTDSLCNKHNRSYVKKLYFLPNLGKHWDSFGGIPDILIFNIIICMSLTVLAALLHALMEHYVMMGTLIPNFKLLFRGLAAKRMAKYFHDQHATFNVFWFTMNKSFLMRTYGETSALYLCLQRYLIALLVTFSILTLPITMTINIAYGKDKTPGYTAKYQSSTIYNMAVKTNISTTGTADSPLLWIHLGIGWLYLPITMMFMKHYADNFLRNLDVSHEKSSSTLIMSWLPENLRFKNRIRQWFQDRYPFVKVRKIYLNYDTSELATLAHWRDTLKLALTKCDPEHSKLYFRECCLSDCCRGADHDERKSAIGTYQSLLMKTKEDIKKKIKETHDEPLDSAFVQVENNQQAKFVVACQRIPKLSDQAIAITLAPHAVDIEWKNMASRKVLLIRKIGVVILLLLFVFFFTTPQAISKFVDRVERDYHLLKTLDTTIENFSESLLSLLILVLVTSIIHCSIMYVGYWKQHSINLNILKLSTAYLTCVLFIFRTLQFTSIYSIAEFIYQYQSHNSSNIAGKLAQVECVYQETGGLDFVHLLITSTYIGNAMEFLRWPDLLCTLVEICKSKSWAEAYARAKTQDYFFWFGDTYSYELFYFILTISLSISHPIMLPIGLLFFIIRDTVASFNLKNRKSITVTRIGINFHIAAISYIIFASVLLQYYNALFLNLKAESITIALVSTFMAMASTVLFLVGISSDWKYPIMLVNPPASAKIADTLHKQDDYIPNYIKKELKEY